MNRATDPRVAQADKEYAKWLTRQTKKSLSLAHLLRKSHIPTETVINAQGTTFVRQEHEDRRHKFVRAENGRFHFGGISEEIARVAGIEPGKIMMKVGEHKGPHNGFGKLHIEKEHGKLMQEAGFKSAEELVQYVGDNYNAIFTVGKGRIALVVEGPPQRVAVVQLSRNKNGGYWSVTTAYPPKNQKFTGTALWRGRQPSQSSSNSTQPLQTINDGHGIEMAISSSHPSSTSGQSASGETNISKQKNEINKSLDGGATGNTQIVMGKDAAASFATSTTDNMTRKTVGNQFINTLHKLRPGFRFGFHNNLHNQNIPSANEKTQPQNDIRPLTMLIKSRPLHGRIDFNGLQVSIETGRSRCREWHNPHDSSQGMSRMTLPYGYIKRTLGVDGDHYDCFVGPDREASSVYIITTMKAPDFSEVDEQKAILGVGTAEEAKRVFMASYNDPRFFGSMTEMPFEEFKEQVLATKDKPKLLGGELA